LLVSNVIPDLAMTGGTVSLGADFQGGAITNLTVAGGTLSGSYTVSGIFNCGASVSGSLLVADGGVMNWSGGTVSGGPLTVAGNGVLNLEGNGTVYLQNGALTNAGTVNWLSGGLNLQMCGSPATGPVVNLAGGLWNIQCDQGLGYNCGLGTNGYFQNAGTVQKSAGTGTTSMQIPFFNSGVVEALQGTLDFQNGGPIEGAFSAAGVWTFGAARSGRRGARFFSGGSSPHHSLVGGRHVSGGKCRRFFRQLLAQQRDQVQT
jgi:hypothetical protein